MYFSGTLAIDPSQLTQIEKVKPTKVFKRILFFLTAGGVSDQMERETFTALGILQKLNAAFRSIGIDNIVRLSHDDIDFYFDHDGKKGDLQEALDHYDLKIDDDVSAYFSRLDLVLEHEDSVFSYLIDITINRTHDVGAYPIEINVSGLLKAFQLEEEDEAQKARLRNRLDKLFADKTGRENFIKRKELEFNQFVTSLNQSIRKFIKVDDIKSEIKQKIVVPKKRIDSKAPVPQNRKSREVVFHGYYGYSHLFWYSMIWSDVSREHNVFIHDADCISDTGDFLGEIGSDGLNAGDSSLFDFDQPIEERASSFEEFSETPFEGDPDFVAEEAGGVWDYMFDGGSGDGGGCSSCASCASCGGCGGCGGA